MVKSVSLSLLLFAIVLVAACNQEITERELDPSESNIQEGYVIEVKGSQILVVSDISLEDAHRLDEALLLEEGVGGLAVWYTVEDVTRYEKGQRLRVRSKSMMESYPAISEAVKVQIVEE
ncbi:YobA family protein [Evansella cellulosilytica]|uniref:DUF3221 domain-containing protein n=1 Tax=Evansella cellulosilytica (strain ATCC 21833 / DSM 2522 / FERM P-1141 / JCM 9156 / N-4) TaxID=649639 RepID=E6TVD4_EVAC2|nr:YobA family protein [Evansella cellulosilytica]ADU30951.1 hypothetical protein Bcell_2696 [Evansella cellulosilytica DSM 2522]